MTKNGKATGGRPPSMAASPLPRAVLLFVADDVGIGDIGASGYNTTRVATPHIDALAERGARFTHMHSAATLCSPSRYSLLTGNLPMRGHLPDGQWTIFKPQQVTPGQRTLGHLFAAAGWSTALIGKMHLGGLMANRDGSYCAYQDGAARTVDWPRGLLQRMDLGFEYVFESHDGIQAWRRARPRRTTPYATPPSARGCKARFSPRRRRARRTSTGRTASP